MNREDAKQYIKEHYLSDYLRRMGVDPGADDKKPFCCLNPAHNDSKPSMSIVTKGAAHTNCHCFSCGATYDIYSLIELDTGKTGRDVFDYAFSLYGTTIDSGTPYHRTTAAEDFRQAEAEERREAARRSDAEITGKDYTSFYQSAHAAVATAAEYIKSRGLTAETVNRFNIGYSAAAPDADRKPRLIIPCTKSFYLARYIGNEEIDNKYQNIKGSTVQLFNAAALRSAELPVFITEGAMDAISIMQVGGAAVALNGVTNAKKIVTACEEKAPVQPLILCLDNDKRGQEAQEKLAEQLSALNIPFITGTISGAKDANELLAADADQLREQVKTLMEKATAAAADAETEALMEYRRSSSLYAVDSMLDAIKDSVGKGCIPTGYKIVDELLDGGLYAGLYILGAISSAGKTTFTMQMADQIAESGTDVLIFSLEMARNELIAKSLSRLTLRKDIEQNRCILRAKTTRGILNGNTWKYYKTEDYDLIGQAVDAYKSFAEHIYIKEGVGDIGVSEIRATVERHIKLTGRTPVVFVDYLQILAPEDMRASDKQNTDKAVLELKRMSRDYDLPVVAISSFNRDNYNEPVNLTSFKESGAIEYSSDVLIGMQYEGMDYQDGDTDAKRKARIRQLLTNVKAAAAAGNSQDIQLKILKNRNGRSGTSASIKFYPRYNTFEDR